MHFSLRRLTGRAAANKRVGVKTTAAGVISAGAGLVSILSYTHSLKSKLEGLDSLATGTLAAAIGHEFRGSAL